jgi:hypothetical protein
MSVAKRNAKWITITQGARSRYKLHFVDLCFVLWPLPWGALERGPQRTTRIWVFGAWATASGPRQFMRTFHTEVTNPRPQPTSKVCVNLLECGYTSVQKIKMYKLNKSPSIFQWNVNSLMKNVVNYPHSCVSFKQIMESCMFLSRNETIPVT